MKKSKNFRRNTRKKNNRHRSNKKKYLFKKGGAPSVSSILNHLINQFKRCLNIDNCTPMEIDTTVQDTMNKLAASEGINEQLYKDLHNIIGNKENNLNASEDIEEKKKEIKKIIKKIKRLKRQLEPHSQVSRTTQKSKSTLRTMR